MKNLIAIPLVILLSSTEFAQGVGSSSGSGIAIGSGNILTNFHVVDQCIKIEVKLQTDGPEKAVLIAQDPKNDLAVIRINASAKSVASFREGAPVRVGDTVLALGYPLSGVLASSANLSVGIVSALAGLGDDSRFIQISAPVQPGMPLGDDLLVKQVDIADKWASDEIHWIKQIGASFSSNRMASEAYKHRGFGWNRHSQASGLAQHHGAND